MRSGLTPKEDFCRRENTGQYLRGAEDENPVGNLGGNGHDFCPLRKSGLCKIES